MSKNQANNQYKYDSNDVTRILNLRLEQEQGNLSNVFPIAAIGDLDHAQLRTQLEEESQRNGATLNRTILIPYNLGDSHWVGIVIRLAANQVPTINYYDSLGQNINQQILEELKTIYRDTVNPVTATGLTQTDMTSCGPLAIENLINDAGNHVIIENTDARKIRNQHILLMDQFAPEYMFGMLQHYNVNSLKKSSSLAKSVKKTDFNFNQEDAIKNIAQEYEKNNLTPELSATELLSCMIIAIEYAIEHSKEPHKYYESKPFLVAIAACAQAMILQHEQFIKDNLGIPWKALAYLVKNAQFYYEPSHGINGGVIVTSKNYISLEDNKKIIQLVVDNLGKIKIALLQLNKLPFFQQKIPLSSEISAVDDYFSEEKNLLLLKQAIQNLNNTSLDTEGGRISFIRQISVIGEALGNLPINRQKILDQEVISIYKYIRNAIDHPETEFIQILSTDRELKELVVWLKNFVANGVNKKLIEDANTAKNKVKAAELHLLKIFYDYYQVQPHDELNLEESTCKIWDDLTKGLLNILKYLTLDLTTELDDPGTRSLDDHIMNNARLYGDNFIESLSDNPAENVFDKIQFLYEFSENYLKALHGDAQLFIQKYEKIKQDLLAFKKVNKFLNGQPTEVIEYIGVLNKVAQKGGAESLNSLKEILYYMYLFKHKYNELKLNGTSNDNETIFLEEYASVRNSYEKKICSMLTQLEKAEKQKDNKTIQRLQKHFEDLQQFLKFYSEEFKFIHDSFEKAWGITEIGDKVSSVELDFMFLYLRVEKICNELIANLNSNNSYSRTFQKEKIIDLISEMTSTMYKVLEYKHKVELLIKPLNEREAGYLKTLNEYNLGVELLNSIGRQKFIQTQIDDSLIREFSDFLSMQDATVHIKIKQINSAGLSYKTNLALRDRGFPLIQMPDGFDESTFHQVNEVNYRDQTPQERKAISDMHALYHQNREYYTILVGSYARALLDNKGFLQYASEELIDTLNLFRSARGYEGHNTYPNLGKGSDIKMHSSTIAHTVVEKMLLSIPELILIRNFLSEDTKLLVKATEAYNLAYSRYSGDFSSSEQQLLEKLELIKSVLVTIEEDSKQKSNANEEFHGIDQTTHGLTLKDIQINLANIIKANLRTDFCVMPNIVEQEELLTSLNKWKNMRDSTSLYVALVKINSQASVKHAILLSAQQTGEKIQINITEPLAKEDSTFCTQLNELHNTLKAQGFYDVAINYAGIQDKNYSTCADMSLIMLYNIIEQAANESIIPQFGIRVV